MVVGVGNPKDVRSWEIWADGECPDLIPELPWKKGEQVEFGCHFWGDDDWAGLGSEVGVRRKVREGDVGKMSLSGSGICLRILTESIVSQTQRRFHLEGWGEEPPLYTRIAVGTCPVPRFPFTWRSSWSHSLHQVSCMSVSESCCMLRLRLGCRLDGAYREVEGRGRKWETSDEVGPPSSKQPLPVGVVC